MQTKILSALLVFISFLMLSCTSTLSEEEYISWVKDPSNGLNKKKEIGMYIFEAQYKPKEISILQNYAASDTLLEPVASKGQELLCVDLKITDKDGADFIKESSVNGQDYNTRLYYYSFTFQNSLAVQVGDSVYPCVLYHFERSYGLKATRTFILGFDVMERKKEEDVVLIVDGRELGVGIFRIKFDKESLNNIPKVIL